MNTTLVIATSVLLQIVAAIFALYQIREMELRRTWLAIAAALMLMSVPRSITLIKLITGQISHPPALESELVALDVSFLMGIGVAYATRLFRSLKRAHADLMRSQQSLIDSELRLRNLFDNAPIAILTVNSGGEVLNVNRAAEELVGAERKTLVGRPSSELPLFKRPEASPNRGSQPNAMATTDLSFDVGFTNGRNRIVHAEVRGFEMTIGSETYRTYIARDVSEKKRLRAETDSLEAQLRHAERLQTVGTLAGGIAHDFNNILTPIVGYTQLAMKESSTDEVSRDYLEHVIRGALRAKDLVKQILAFSRQGNKLTQPVQLQSLIKETMTLLRASLPSTIEIEMTIDNNCRVVLADPGQIHQVIMNLCTNAFHAMRESGGRLIIGLQEHENGSHLQNGLATCKGPVACLTVQDTGCGMEQATLSRIFEPFFTTKSEGQGSGLGLAVVHGIISAHGGMIVAESEPGKGTKFIVCLPIDLRPCPERVAVDEAPVTGTERVLVVDDEPDVAVLVSQMLRSHGFKPVHRTSSVEAYRAFCANPNEYDIVVTDQTMPHMTGIELAAEIKRKRGDIPVILMTGFSEKISPENYRSMGVDGYLMKPVLANTLTRMIRSLTCVAESESAAHP